MDKNKQIEKMNKKVEEMVKKDLKNMPHIPQKWDINIDLDSINDDEI